MKWEREEIGHGEKNSIFESLIKKLQRNQILGPDSPFSHHLPGFKSINDFCKIQDCSYMLDSVSRPRVFCKHSLQTLT